MQWCFTEYWCSVACTFNYLSTCDSFVSRCLKSTRYTATSKTVEDLK